MLNIIICEDEIELLQTYQLIVKNYIKAHPQVKIQLVLATSNPRDVEIYMADHPNDLKLYILDIEFPASKIKGIDLASKIRETDLNAKIIFITTHEELSTLTFERKVEPLDYITKESGLNVVKKRLNSGIDTAITRLVPLKNQSINNFIYTVGPRQYEIPVDNIDYFEASENSHNVFLHSLTEITEFKSSLIAIQTDYKNFYRVHKSLLVNMNNIASIDQKNRKIIFKDKTSCDISRRRLAQFKKDFANSNSVSIFK